MLASGSADTAQVLGARYLPKARTILGGAVNEAETNPVTGAVFYNGWNPIDTTMDDPNATPPATGADLGHPLLMVSTSPGQGSTFRTDAFSFAINRKGQIAFAQGSGGLKMNRSWLTTLVVSDATSKTTTRVGDPAKQVVDAWAGGQIIVTRSLDDQEYGQGQIMAVDKSGQPQRLDTSGYATFLGAKRNKVFFSELDAAGNPVVMRFNLATGTRIAVKRRIAGSAVVGAATDDGVATASTESGPVQVETLDDTAADGTVQSQPVDSSSATLANGSFGAVSDLAQVNGRLQIIGQDVRSSSLNYMVASCTLKATGCTYKTATVPRNVQVMTINDATELDN